MTDEERKQVAERIRKGEFGDRWRLSLEQASRPRREVSVEELELEYMKKLCPHCGKQLPA